MLSYQTSFLVLNHIKQVSTLTALQIKGWCDLLVKSTALQMELLLYHLRVKNAVSRKGAKPKSSSFPRLEGQIIDYGKCEMLLLLC